MCLYAFLAFAAEGNARTMLGIWLRPETIRHRGTSEVATEISSHRVDALFILTPLPLTTGGIEEIKDLLSVLPSKVEVHLWLTVYRNQDYLETNTSEQFTAADGLVETGWVNPCSATYRARLLEWIGIMIDELHPSGLFLDYFYAPIGPFDNETLRRFSIALGRNVTRSNLTVDAALLGEFLEWRNQRMIETLRAIRLKTQRESIRLSVFIRMVEESERFATGQDILRFRELSDFLVPNTYHIAAGQAPSWVGDSVRALRALGVAEVWSGIQAFDISPLQTYKAVRSARNAGAKGVILFRYGTMSGDHWKHAGRAMGGYSSPWWMVLAGLVLAPFVAWILRHRPSAGRVASRKAVDKSKKKQRT